MKLNHLLINDLMELCRFYVKREDIVQKAPGKYGSNMDHSKSQAQVEDARSRRNFVSNQSY